jgi:hypothetical protein
LGEAPVAATAAATAAAAISAKLRAMAANHNPMEDLVDDLMQRHPWQGQ